jgi:hypothetical protein
MIDAFRGSCESFRRLGMGNKENANPLASWNFSPSPSQQI